MSKSLSSPTLAAADNPYTLPFTGTFGWAGVDNMQPDPVGYYSAQAGLPAPDTTLDYVGRNHGPRRVGSVRGSSKSGWDLRRSNFLYVDGHVESHHIVDTLAPRSQWGTTFYSLPATP